MGKSQKTSSTGGPSSGILDRMTPEELLDKPSYIGKLRVRKCEGG
jgi:hypothetical protein